MDRNCLVHILGLYHVFNALIGIQIYWDGQVTARMIFSGRVMSSQSHQQFGVHPQAYVVPKLRKDPEDDQPCRILLRG